MYVKDIIHEYVKFKNQLLFTKEFRGTLFNNSVIIDNQWVIKRISDFGEDGIVKDQIYSYGKIVDNNFPENRIHAIGAYITVNGIESFVTLAVTPDDRNSNVNKEALDISKLIGIYDKVTESGNPSLPLSAKGNYEVPINKEAIEIFKGVYIPKNRITKDYHITPLQIAQLSDKFPGAEISDVKIFKNDLEYIKSELLRYGEVSPKMLTDEKLMTYRFRPYIVISYIENNVSFSRIILLKNKSRSALEFWEEFTDIRKLNATKAEEARLAGDDKEEAIKMNFLISHYRSWELLFNYFKYLEDDKREAFRDRMKYQFIGTYQNQFTK
jgi:hypothetical protein